jgi:hypothetical protein
VEPGIGEQYRNIAGRLSLTVWRVLPARRTQAGLPIYGRFLPM